MEHLFSVVWEAAHRASIVPFASEAAIYAMQAFGQPLLLPVLAAIAGGVLGHFFNWGVGRALMRLPSAPVHQPIYHLLQTHFNRYGFVVLLFAWVPLGNILAVAAGMMNTPLKKALPAIAAGLVFHYGRLLVI
jgi:membrane protein YqaA with SNARE-associated domain